MIAVDTSSLRRFLAGKSGRDVDAVAGAIEDQLMILPPVVLTEILSDPATGLTSDVLSAIPQLEVTDGYWMRAGLLRAKVIAAGHKSKVAEALIAQSCLDHNVALVTNDRDFRHYTRHGLVLV